jgi:uncharacterized membrane protein
MKILIGIIVFVSILIFCAISQTNAETWRRIYEPGELEAENRQRAREDLIEQQRQEADQREYESRKAAKQAQKEAKKNRSASMSSNIAPPKDVGPCMGSCASEQGICIAGCRGDGPCIGQCGAAHGRCVARCH